MDSRRFLLAIVLSAIVVIAYEQYLRIYYPASRGGPSETTSVAPDGIPENALPDRGEAPPGFPFADAVPADVPDSFTRPEGDVFVENDVFRARFASRGARLVSLQLKTYRSSIDQDSAGYQLVTPDVADLPLGVTLRGEESYPDSEIVYDASTYYLAFDGEGERTLTFSGALPGGGRIEKRLRFYKDRYYFDVEVSVRGSSKRYSEISLGWVRLEQGEAGYKHFRGVEALVGRKIRHFEPEEIAQGVIVPKPGDDSLKGPVRWAGYADIYFLSAILPSDDNARLWVKRQPSGVVATEVLVPMTGAGGGSYPFRVFTGPKDLEVLDSVGNGLARTVDLGWFSFIAEPMLRGLKLFHSATGNYGIDIILLTISREGPVLSADQEKHGVDAGHAKGPAGDEADPGEVQG